MAQMIVPLAISAAFQVLSLLLMPKPKVDKPKLPDQSYGTPIPKGWGRFVVNANYIWGYTAEDSGGKGALGPKPPKFNGTFGLLLCEGVIEDIRRVWWDGGLVYDKTPRHDPDPDYGIPIPDFGEPIVIPNYDETEEASDRMGRYMHLYRGSAAQDPNPDYQDRVGTSVAPAYRGFATLVYSGVPLEDGRVPYSIRVEVVERSETLYLSDILRDICLDAKYTPQQIDVEDVNDIVVRGFFRNPEPPIETIKRLQIAYQFDVVDLDGKVAFKKQSRSGAYGLARTDLGSYEYGNNAEPVLFRHKILNETEKIHEVRIKYINYRKEYEDDEVYQRRIAVNPEAINKQDFETNLTLDPNEASSIAARILYLAQLRSDQFSFSLPLHYFNYFPNDVLYGEFYERKYTAVQIVKKRVGFNGLIDFEGILYGVIPYYQCHGGAYVPPFQLPLPDSDTSNPIFDYETPGQSFNPPSPNILFGGDSLCKLLDIPLIRDSDSEAGLYAVSAGTYSWRGGNLYLANTVDELAYYQLAMQLRGKSTWGNCQNTLGSASRYVIDRFNFIDVILETGSLTNITLNQMTGGDNTVLLWKDTDRYEILRFQNAELIGPKRYRLTNLERGVRGTEWGISGHQSGEVFYLLRERGYYERLEGDVRNIGTTLLYRVPAFDQTLDEATAATLTPKGYDLYPYAPCTIRGIRDALGNLNIRWVRRDRKGEDLPWFSVVPLSEIFERYVVQISNGATVVREVLVSDVREYVYDSEEQTTDFGGLQSSVTVRIYQVSGTVGKGFAGVATV